MKIQKNNFARMRRELLKGQQIICMSPNVFIAYNLVAREMAIKGKEVKSKIVKGFKD